MFVHTSRGGIAGDRAPLHEIETADLVEPEDVIRVAVREDDCVHAGEAVRERLLPEIRRGVHQDRRVSRYVDVDRRAQPLVARIGRLAHGARAADARYARRGARTEKRYTGIHPSTGLGTGPSAWLGAQGMMMRDFGSGEGPEIPVVAST